MKQRVLCAILALLLLLCGCESRPAQEESAALDTPIATDPAPDAPPSEGDHRAIPYPEQWLDPASTEVRAEAQLPELIIEEIYADCFIGRPVVAMPYTVKVNTSLAEDWCVNDQVAITFQNARYDYKNFHYEVDLLTITEGSFTAQAGVAYKPVIYLYPEEETALSVRLALKGNLTCAYPTYQEGWSVTAAPDGTLTDQAGQPYNYLYWEGELDATYDFSKGFCIKGEDTAAFLEEALNRLGLTRKEANEFIVFWLPMMEKNPYNIIAFQQKAYTDAAALEIQPCPDTLIRVFMAWRASNSPIEIPAQTLSAPPRRGFTAVEWGGTALS